MDRCENAGGTNVKQSPRRHCLYEPGWTGTEMIGDVEACTMDVSSPVDESADVYCSQMITIELRVKNKSYFAKHTTMHNIYLTS